MEIFGVGILTLGLLVYLANTVIDTQRRTKALQQQMVKLREELDYAREHIRVIRFTVEAIRKDTRAD